MTVLLKLFPMFRRLVAQVDELAARNIALEDEIRVLRRARDNAEQRVSSAETEARRAWETVANWLAKRAGLGTISMPHEAIPDPPRTESEPIRSDHPLARQIVEDAERKFEEEFAALLTSSAS